MHLSEPLPITDDIQAVLCASRDPVTGRQDEPYVLIGPTEYSVAEARRLAAALDAMADAGSSPQACSG